MVTVTPDALHEMDKQEDMLRNRMQMQGIQSDFNGPSVPSH
jgi:hypothetical protein